MSSFRFRSLIFFVFVILILELSLRLSGIYTTLAEKNFYEFVNPFHQNFQPHYKPNSSSKMITDEFNFSYFFDEYGFRNEKIMLDKAHAVAFGDSFTEGMGTHQDSTWVKFLSAKLNVSIYNAGKIGSDPYFYLQEYKSLRKIFNGKSVIVLLNYSDIADFRFRHSKNISQNVNINLYQHLHLYRLYSHFFLRKDYMFLDKNNRNPVLEKILSDITATLVQLNKECKKDNRKLLVLIHPLPQQYYKNLDSRLDFNYVENLVAQLNLNHVKTFSIRKDMEKLIKTKEEWRKISWEIDGHFNAKGYESLAHVIYDKLKATKDF